LAVTKRQEEVNDLPPIEQNQFVSRTTPDRQPSAEPVDSDMSETTFVENVEQEQSVTDEIEQNETIAEEVIVAESSDVKHETTEQEQSSGLDSASTNTERNVQTSETLVNEVTEDQVTAETNEESVTTSEPQQEEATNEDTVDSTDNEESTHRQKVKKIKEVNISRKSASDEQEDPLITKLDKKIDKELRVLQGSNDDVDNGDDDNVEDETLNDLLYGQRAKELDDFLKS